MTMQNDNRIVQGLWVGGRLSTLERLCIRSFCANGHLFHLYHYDELQNVPQTDGLQLINAEAILPRSAIFRHKTGTLAFFADHFRWELLRQKGGWWADMDTICIRPFDFAADVVFSHDGRPNRLLNGMLKFPPGHFLTAILADSYNDINRFQPWDKPLVKFHKTRRRLTFWQDSRPHIRGRDAGGMSSFAAAVKHFDLQKYIQAPTVFMLPDDPRGIEVVKSANWNMTRILSTAPDLRCVHLCNSFFALEQIDKNGTFPPDSLYETLKRQYPEPKK